MSQQNNNQDNDIKQTHTNLYKPSDNNKKNKKKGKKSAKKIAIIVVSVIAAVALAFAAVWNILVYMGKGSMLKNNNKPIDTQNVTEDFVTDDDGLNVEYEGVKYTYNKNITNILFMGIDRKNFAENAKTYGTNGQADALFLFSMDTKTGKSTIIPIPRDSMVDVDLYSAGGQYISSEKQQICLAYAYGDGKKSSCENAVKSASRLLYGLPINSYAAIDLDAITTLTDRVGGVPVTALETMDLSGVKVTKGEKITLYGKQATAYVQNRDKTNLESPLLRMSRQKQFIQSFSAKAIERTKKDITTPVKLYNAVSKNMVTDINVADISFLTSAFLKTANNNISYESISGTMTQNGKYGEYIVDEKSVYKLILKVFYTAADSEAVNSAE